MATTEDLSPSVQEGYDALNEQNWGRARDIFQQVLQREPTNGAVRVWLANAYYLLEQYDDALTELEIALQNDLSNTGIIEYLLDTLAAKGSEIQPYLEGLADRVTQSSALLLELERQALIFEGAEAANGWLERLVQIEVKDPFDVFNRAQAYWMLEHNEAARKEYDRLIDLDGNSPWVYAERAEFLAAIADTAGALADFKKLSELDPQTSLGYKRSGDLYFTQKDYNRALAMYRKALKRDPGDTDALVGKGLCLENRSKFSQALEVYDQLVEQNPTSLDGYFYRGRVYEAQNDLQKALKEYQQMTRYGPQDRDGYWACARLYRRLGDYARAARMYRKILAMDPEDVDAHNSLGRVLENVGRFPQALREFRRVIRLAPSQVVGYLNAGDIYRLLGQGERAVEMYSRAIQLEPDTADCHSSRGVVYQELREFDKAELDFKRAIELVGQDTEAYLTLAGLYYEWDKVEEALEVCEKILEWDSDNVDVLLDLAQIYEKLDEKMDALRQYNRILRKDKTIWEAYERRGRLYVLLEEYAKSLPDLEKALALEPKAEVALLYRGILWENCNHLSRALENYQAYAQLQSENPQAYKNVADMLISLEGYDLAVAAFDQALALQPGDMDALANKADALRLWATDVDAPQQFDRAIQVIDQVLAQEPRNDLALAIKGTCLGTQGKLSEGLTCFDAALAVTPDYAWVINQKARLLYLNGNFEAALPLFMQLKNNVPIYHLSGGAGAALALLRLGRQEEAASLLAEMVGANPRAEDYMDRCYAMNNLKEHGLALEACLHATEMESAPADAFNMAAWILGDTLATDLEKATLLAERGIELARAALEQAESKDQAIIENAVKVENCRSLLGEVLDTLGWVWYRRGDLAKARDYLKEGIGYQPQDQQKREHLRKIEEGLANI